MTTISTSVLYMFLYHRVIQIPKSCLYFNPTDFLIRIHSPVGFNAACRLNTKLMSFCFPAATSQR